MLEKIGAVPTANRVANEHLVTARPPEGDEVVVVVSRIDGGIDPPPAIDAVMAAAAGNDIVTALALDPVVTIGSQKVVALVRTLDRLPHVVPSLSPHNLHRRRRAICTSGFWRTDNCRLAPHDRGWPISLEASIAPIRIPMTVRSPCLEAVGVESAIPPSHRPARRRGGPRGRTARAGGARSTGPPPWPRARRPRRSGAAPAAPIMPEAPFRRWAARAITVKSSVPLISRAASRAVSRNSRSTSARVRGSSPNSSTSLSRSYAWLGPWFIRRLSARHRGWLAAARCRSVW